MTEFPPIAKILLDNKHKKSSQSLLVKFIPLILFFITRFSMSIISKIPLPSTSYLPSLKAEIYIIHIFLT